jgi:ribosomal 50S subunit-associated protein YjgA (DUF615 family)
MIAPEPTFEDLQVLLTTSERLQRSELPQVKMLGVRVHALTRSLLDSTVVDETLLEVVES